MLGPRQIPIRRCLALAVAITARSAAKVIIVVHPGRLAHEAVNPSLPWELQSYLDRGPYPWIFMDRTVLWMGLQERIFACRPNQKLHTDRITYTVRSPKHNVLLLIF